MVSLALGIVSLHQTLVSSFVANLPLVIPCNMCWEIMHTMTGEWWRREAILRGMFCGTSGSFALWCYMRWWNVELTYCVLASVTIIWTNTSDICTTWVCPPVDGGMCGSRQTNGVFRVFVQLQHSRSNRAKQVRLCVIITWNRLFSQFKTDVVKWYWRSCAHRWRIYPRVLEDLPFGCFV